MADETVETGLTGLTAAVTPTEAPPAEQLPDGWNLHKVAALVRDLAHNMYDLPVILKKHGLTEGQHALLAKNEFFQRALEQATIDWNRADNIQRRLALEAAIALEDALPNVAARAHKPNEDLADIVQLVKVLAEIAGTIGNKAAAQPVGPSEKFKIIINLGADNVIRREATVEPKEIRSDAEGPSSIRSVQSLLEAAGVPAPVQPYAQGSRN